MSNLIASVLSVANQETNQNYPPFIADLHINLVTSFLISSLVKSYPGSPYSLDLLDPFINFSMISVQKGVFVMPQNYRNILGTPYIFVNKNQDGQCGQIPQITTTQEFQTAQLKGGCQATSLTIVSESEFSVRTSSSYKYPTHKNPIGYFTGQKTVKICPFDLTVVALLYVRNENTYQTVYTSQPDDTYLVNDTASTQPEWNNNAFDIVLKGLISLYGVYASDKNVQDYSQVLNQAGLL